MNNEEILKKAIQKALDNGWLKLNGKIVKSKDIITSELDIIGAIKFRYVDEGRKINTIDLVSPFNSIIFSHSFAKAFWGEEHKVNSFVPDYLYHLQQMVVEEDPIKYLEKFI